jgi:hypothetical protein
MMEEKKNSAQKEAAKIPNHGTLERHAAHENKKK